MHRYQSVGDGRSRDELHGLKIPTIMQGATAATNVRWVAVSQLGRACIQFASVFVFSRLLSPSDFGLFAMAIVVGNFVAVFRDMGTSAAIIQRQNINEEMLDTVFVLSFACAICIYAVVAAASPFVAGIFGNPELRDILLLIGIGFAVASFGASQLALLERTNQFRKIAWIEISSDAVGFLLALAAALLGAGIYSLVLQILLSTACSTAQLWLTSSWRPKLRGNMDELRYLLKFSGNLVTFNVINYFARNSDSILIGRFLDAASLGWYSMANRILMFPLQGVTSVLGRALLPVYSRHQDDLNEVASYYLTTLALIAAVTAPLMLGTWALRGPLVTVALGQSWSPVADLLAWFAPMGVFQSLNSTTGTILLARGRPDVLRTLGIANTVALVSAFVVGLHFGLIGLARAYFFATVIITVVNLHVVLGEVRSSLIALKDRILIPVACAGVMAGIVALLDQVTASRLSNIVQLVLLIPFGMCIYTVLMFLFSWSLVRKLYATLHTKTAQ